MSERIHVTASNSYDVIIGSGTLKNAAELIGNVLGKTSLMVVSDDRVYPLYGKVFSDSLSDAGFRVENFVFKNGEASKTLSTYGKLLSFICSEGFTRSDAVVAFGGGVTGDIAGFAAATYQRGIRFVQVPTTLLACVDSSVGGKTGVNLPGGKNQVGSFHQPSLVICDPDLLKTLPRREYACGCAEIIKYAMIGSESFFGMLDTPVSANYESVISTCVKMKRDYVEKDEHDHGLRMMLNFGHTFGHAVEACSGYSVPHGFAVAMGMSTITKAAAAMGVCSPDVPDKLDALLEKYSLPTEIPFSAAEMQKEISVDKKNVGGSVRLIVPEKIGKCVILPVPLCDIPEWLEKGGVK